MSITKNVRSGIISGDSGAQLDLSGTDANIGLAKQPSADGILAPHKNLVVKQATVSTVGVDADEIVVTDASNGDQVLLESWNLTLDLTVSGVNGLDTGAEAADTWYHIWTIWNGTTQAGLFSLSDTAPTMPSGYTHKGYVGATRNDAVSDIITFHQRDRLVGIAVQTDLTDGTATTFTSVTVTIPSTARKWIGWPRLNIDADGLARLVDLQSLATGTMGLQRFQVVSALGSAADYSTPMVVPVINASELFYKIGNATSTNVDIITSGYEF